MKKLLSTEMANIKKVEPLYNSDKKQVYNYNSKDFETLYEPETGKYYIKHKSWKTYITNSNYSLNTLDKAWSFIKEYIEDTNKPYGHRNLKFNLKTA